MSHFNALAAAASGRSPFLAVYPPAVEKPWYAAWTRLHPQPTSSPTGESFIFVCWFFISLSTLSSDFF